MNKILINLPETIESPRLILQTPKAGFGDAVHEAIRDGYEDYVKWMAWPATQPTAISVEEDCRKQHAEFILREFIRYLIIEKSSQTVVGRCGFPPFQANWQVPQFGISYFIRRSHRGKGYATEAAHIMTLIAFRILKARKVEIYCDAENIPSQRIPEKLKFELEYIQTGGWPRLDNQLATLKTYSLFSETRLPNLDIRFSSENLI